jgi:hypothetical protein
MICIGRFSIEWQYDNFIGKFDHKILDYKGISIGMLKIGYWYDDIPEGLK